MFKKIAASILSILTIFAETALPVGTMGIGLLGTPAYAEENSAALTAYTYEVVPLLEPFNEYFFVRTDDPDPHSFCFADNDSVYTEEGKAARISLYEDTFEENDLFADVVYEDEETKRVNGGYIFSSFNTDGGDIVLQKVAERDYWGDPVKWEDTDIKLTLPKLCDDIDYLIDTYAEGDTFFEKMDSVQRGFESICLYSGSNIRGKLVKDSDHWRISALNHTDQSFYILSPYSREGNRRLFATAIYPYRYDSLGFPSVMGTVSTRLDASSSYKWDPYSHAHINVTYNGETRTYGGQGNGEGQGLSEDKITRSFTFDETDAEITLEGSKKLLDEYSQVEMEDDIPREDALTWEAICNTVGDGSWAYVSGGYSYLYKKDDDNSFWADEWGVGNSIYWGGSLGYASDVWIDGRFVSVDETYLPGVTFEEIPDRDIILPYTTIPELKYDKEYVYDPETGSYEPVYKNVEVTERTGILRYYYNEENNNWTAPDHRIFEEMAEAGLIDEKYPDMLQLTYDEVMKLGVDRNTNIAPDKGFIYDGSAEPGTPFDRSSINTVDHEELFADAKAIAEENGLKFSLDDGYYGMCGDFMCWTYLKDSQTLIITGTGDMHIFGMSPWTHSAFYDPDHMPVKQLFVGEGVESIQDEAFRECSQMTKAVLPRSLKKIGKNAFGHSSSLKIYCYTDSIAQQYAIDNDLKYVLLDGQVLGDVNGDGKIDSADVVKVAAYVKGTGTLTEDEASRANVNGDDKIDSSDVVKIAAYVKGVGTLS